MFWNKLASRADETPTYELGFAGHKLGCQKKSSKTQGFSMIFLAARNVCGHPWSPMALKTLKTSIFLSKTICFDEKLKKTQRFFIVLGSRLASKSCLLIPLAVAGQLFFRVISGFRSKHLYEKIYPVWSPSR